MGLLDFFKPKPKQPAANVISQDQMLSRYSFSPGPSLNVSPQGRVLSSQSAFIGPPAPPGFGQPAPRVSGAGGGGGGGGGQVPGANDTFASMSNAAQSQTDAELQGALSAFDYNREQAQNQLGSLGGQRDLALSQMGTELEGVKSQVGKSKQNSKEGTEQNIQDALTTSQEVQRKNRNILRSLGILNSSAAGELLSKPMNEFDTQRAKLSQALLKRNDELDDFLNQKTAEHSQAVAGITQQYNDMVNNIQSDLRFNDRQRADAVKSANAALTQRLSEIKQAQFNYQNQVNSMKNTYSQGLQTLNQYQQPGADLGAINKTTINPGQEQASSDASVYDSNGFYDFNKKDKNLLSGLSY